MVNYVAPLQDLRFLYENVFNFDEFWRHIGRPGDIDIELAEAILDEVAKVAELTLAPLNLKADVQGCRFDDGKIFSPEGFREAYITFSKNGWNGLGGEKHYGGAGLPHTLVTAVDEMVQGSCMSFALSPIATAAAAMTIYSCASDKLKSVYLPKMYSGLWSAAMDITESHAGTDVGLIRTKATANNDGSYFISGTKIFITWGEHDMTENIVHLVLARLANAPEGTKGLSLFLVPKLIPDEAGNPGKRNKVSCGAIEHKMGIRGSATCVMNFDGALGWQLGEANKGLQAMFTMMNSMRLSVATNAVGVAEAALQQAVKYSKERLQGRGSEGTSSDGPANPEQYADPILIHPDVRRMLFTAKANTEASRALYLYVASYIDLTKFSLEEKARTRARDMVAFLTPIAKAFISDTAFESTLLCQQIFGGHGYISEWGQEQHVRDIRVTQMFEGTNGIQALDLIRRKTVMCEGAYFEIFADDVERFLLQHQEQELKEFNTPLRNALETLRSSTFSILTNAQQNYFTTGAIAVDYLKLCGYAAFAFMWARMAAAAISADTEQKRNKLATARFYFDYLLPQKEVHATRVNQSSKFVSAIQTQTFS